MLCLRALSLKICFHHIKNPFLNSFEVLPRFVNLPFSDSLPGIFRIISFRLENLTETCFLRRFFMTLWLRKNLVVSIRCRK